jgi:hypothetical protein
MTRAYLDVHPVFSCSQLLVFTDNHQGNQAIPFDPVRRARAQSRVNKLGGLIDHPDLPAAGEISAF